MPDYVRHGHRISLLPIAAACGMAPRLSAQFGAGRPAAMSKAFHARMAGEAGSAAMMACLSPEEREEVEEWKVPTDVVLGNQVLVFALAEKEVPLGLDDFGYYVDPTTGEDCLTIGHMDFGWAKTALRPDSCGSPGCETSAAYTVSTGEAVFPMCKFHARFAENAGAELRRLEEVRKVAYVADIKKTIWTTTDGPDSLQLHAYGWAFAQKHGCDGYCTGLWIATDGEWVWSQEIVYLDSERGRQIWERIHAAATNPSTEYSSGAHCRGCWSRLHCPEHMLPAILADSWLAPVAEGVVPTPEAARDMLLKGAALEEIWKKAKKQLQEMVGRGAIQIDDGNKTYGAVEVRGRESAVSVEELRAKLGPLAEQCIKRGSAYQQYRWLNRKAG